MPAKSKAQQRFMGMVHAAQKGELDKPSSEVEKAADSMSDADAKDYASTKHKGLPNHVKKENMEKELKEIIRQTYRESLRESVNEAKYPTNLYVGSIIYGQGFTGLKGIEGGKYYKVVEMDDTTATLAPCDQKGKITGSKKVRHKLDSIEGGIKTAKRGDENGIVVESVNESISHEAMGIASMTNTRKEAVQKFIDDNNLDAKEILTHVTKGKLPERIRFVQALVGTPNNSSFKWYVKNYTNESVTEGLKHLIHVETPKEIVSKSVASQIMALAKKGVRSNEIGLNMHFVGDEKAAVGAFQKVKNKIYFDLDTNESIVTEGKKAFKINPPIGKAKYSISSHDGVKKHKDGSDFWDIEIFKNKVDLEKGIKNYSSKGFVKESLNEAASEEAKEIGALTGVRGDAVQKFIDDNNIHARKLLAYLKIKGLHTLSNRMYISTAIVGKPNNKFAQGIIKAFSESVNESIVNEGRYDADLDKIEAVVKNATSFMNVGSELKKAGIKYDFTTSMIPMYMIKVSGNTIAICNKKYAAGAEREVKDIAIGLLN
jgi:hypothetical protein